MAEAECRPDPKQQALNRRNPPSSAHCTSGPGVWTKKKNNKVWELLFTWDVHTYAWTCCRLHCRCVTDSPPHSQTEECPDFTVKIKKKEKKKKLVLTVAWLLWASLWGASLEHPSRTIKEGFTENSQSIKTQTHHWNFSLPAAAKEHWHGSFFHKQKKILTSVLLLFLCSNNLFIFTVYVVNICPKLFHGFQTTAWLVRYNNSSWPN